MSYSDFLAGVTETKNFDMNSTFIPGQEPKCSTQPQTGKRLKKLSKWFSCLSVPKVPEDSKAMDSYIITWFPLKYEWQKYF